MRQVQLWFFCSTVLIDIYWQQAEPLSCLCLPSGGLPQAHSSGHLHASSSPHLSSPPGFFALASPTQGGADHADDNESVSSGESNPHDKDAEEPNVGYTEDQGALCNTHHQEFHQTQAFVDALQTAVLAGSGLDDGALARLCKACMFLAHGDASEDNYSDIQAAAVEYVQAIPVATDPIPTYEQVKQLISKLTGITAVRTDTCTNSCVAYMGPFKKLLKCPKCGEL